MTPLEFTTLINTAATALSEPLSDDEIALAAAVFTQIGDVLATIAVVRAAQAKYI